MAPATPLSSDSAAHRDDHALVAGIRVHDERAFEELFQRYYAKLARFAQQYVGSAALADDIVSEVFVAVWNFGAEWTPGESVAAYLFQAIRNRARNVIRDNQTADHYLARAAVEAVPGMGESGIAPDLAVEASERESRLWSAVATLPERARVLIELRWRSGLSPAEIAAALGISVTAVNTAMSRALQALRVALPKDFR